jgi:hypothetical protein
VDGKADTSMAFSPIRTGQLSRRDSCHGSRDRQEVITTASFPTRLNIS